MLENCSTKGLGLQLLVQHFKIISINSCFTYKYSNFIWLNILNKCSGPVLKVSRFSFLATINTWRKFTYRGSAALLRSVPSSCFVSIWVFSRRCWTSGSFTTSIVCSSNNPKFLSLPLKFTGSALSTLRSSLNCWVWLVWGRQSLKPTCYTQVLHLRSGFNGVKD